MTDFETPNIDFSNRDAALQQIWSFVQSFQEQVSFWLRNLDKDSFNEAGLKEITAPIEADLEDVAGNVTALQVTAEGLQSQVTDAEGKASSAKQTADGVQVEVDGLKSRNTVTIDSTGLYVTDATGKTTKLAGDHITSGTIQGVKLISTDGSRHVIINKGNIELGDKGSGTIDPAVIFYNTSSALLYMHCRDDIQISSAGGSISLVGDTEIKGDLNISRNINSSGVMKFDAGGNMSIDANDRIYIGGSNSGETIQIGTSGATINLIGDVTLNGAPLTAGSST